MEKQKNKEVIDKQDCFAWLSVNECNALSKKECSNCNFYQHYSKVNGYEKYLPSKYKDKNKKK